MDGVEWDRVVWSGLEGVDWLSEMTKGGLGSMQPQRGMRRYRERRSKIWPLLQN